MVSKPLAAKPRCAAIIATFQREHLLFERCLPSILAQSEKPDLVVLVNDDDQAHDLIARARTWAQQQRLKLVSLPNQRSRGAAGAWNTALYVLLDNVETPRDWRVAFLDDDDAWDQHHIELTARCFQQGAMWSATGFRRITQQGTRTILPPTRVRPSDFLVGNPGIQGSNLSAKLDCLLHAGGFDEALAACTDRDLCYRLTCFSPRSYKAIGDVTVSHYACDDRPRLSGFGDSRRVEGLAAFERKYAPFMSHQEQEAFHKRAASYFGYKRQSLAEESSGNVPIPSRTRETSGAVCQPVHLIIGAITDPDREAALRGLMEDALNLQRMPGLLSVELLLLNNGREPIARERLARDVSTFREKGLPIYLVHASQLACVNGGVLRRLAIAEARTQLQAALYRLARRRPGCAVWIVDDDMRLDAMVQGTENRARKWPDLPAVLAQMRREGAGIGIGYYTGAPPLPSLATLRLQLLDLVWTLRWLSNMPADTAVEAGPERNRPADFYYDLSANRSDHLESPRLVSPEGGGETASRMLDRVANMAEQVLTGCFPTRQLAGPRPAAETLHRGGNTLVTDIEALRDAPNLSPVVNGQSTRRADMIWVWQQEALFGRKVSAIDLGVFHDRFRAVFSAERAVTTMIDDIRGHVAQAVLKDALGTDCGISQSALAARLDQRLKAFARSVWRIEGLHQELSDWYDQHRRHAGRSGAVEGLLTRLEQLSLPTLAERVEAGARQITVDDIEAFRQSLPAMQADYQQAFVRENETDHQLEGDRVENARARLALVRRTDGPLALLGMGAEAVVFTDHRSVFKVFDYIKHREPGAEIGRLAAMARRWPDAQSLYTIQEVLVVQGLPVLVYAYEETGPYQGGHGPGLVELLAECHRYGLVCQNLHPKNLRISGDRVRLIDYGRDTFERGNLEAADVEFERMCRRAFLVWRWSWRSDLDGLLRASIRDGNLPELEGFDRFMKAVRLRIGLEEGDDPVLNRARQLPAGRLLDFGCGKGEQARKLAEAGHDVWAYDPDESLAARFPSAEGAPRFSADLKRVLEDGPYDLVICRRVACTLDDSAFEALCRDLRRAVSEQGRVLFAVCHPVYAPECMTPEAAPVNTVLSGKHGTVWTKQMLSTGRSRHEVFRTERALRQRLERSGFRILAKRERETVDLERFEPIADLLVLELEPVPAPEVTLVIKACAMEADTIEHQVRHQVEALSGHGHIADIVLAVDDRTDGFARPHARADLQGLRKAAERLECEGWIDRVITAPVGVELETLNQAWFATPSRVTHAANGAQLAVTLAAFETCQTRYVLHLDADIMIGRKDKSHDVIGEMLAALKHKAGAVTAAFPIAGDAKKGWSTGSDQKAWRVETRAGLIDLERLRGLRPFPVETDAALPAWHRALDRQIAKGAGKSLRGGSFRVFFVHPPNTVKSNLEPWFMVMERLARGFCPPEQFGRVEWTGDLAPWLVAERSEPVVFIICGRNVGASRMRRCLDSLRQQSFGRWGAVLLDDASDPGLSSELDWLCRSIAGQVTHLRLPFRRGLLANMDLAIRRLCGNPESIIVTLDLDDALIGTDVIDTLVNTYAEGADLTVGSMLRTDKASPGKANFQNPRGERGGNVWQHLRSFRKSLWDALPEHCLKLDGDYVDLANDWAYMLPLCELAQNPVFLAKPLYLHEPSGKRDTKTRLEREAIISRLCAMPALSITSEQGDRQHHG